MAALIQVLENHLNQKGREISNLHQRVMLKEILQSYVLSFLYNHKDYRFLNFYGGTCLRVIYNLNRMSEDIDLDNSRQVNIDSLEMELRNFFKNATGIDQTSSSLQISKNQITRITLRFPVLFALNLSNHENENLHLKLEISHHQQTAVIQKTPVVYYGKSFIPNHFSIETMFSGKILACLERNFQVGESGVDFKARDFYDLIWLMQQKLQPDSQKLENDGKHPYEIKEAFHILDKRVKNIAVSDLKRSLTPLFDNPEFINFWCEAFHENFELFSRYYLN